MDARFCDLILFVPVIVMIISDLRRREVNFLWLAVFAAGVLTISLSRNGLEQTLQNVTFNSLLLLYMTLSIVIYLRIKHKRWLNPFREHLGWGDMVFFVSLTPFLGLREYLALLIISCVAGFLFGILLKYRSPEKPVTVPMVSVVGVILCVYILYKDFVA